MLCGQQDWNPCQEGDEMLVEREGARRNKKRSGTFVVAEWGAAAVGKKRSWGPISD